MKLLRISSNAGNADAKSIIGLMHETDLVERYGLKKNRTEAMNFLYSDYHLGSSYASIALGYRYYEGIGVRKSRKKATNFTVSHHNKFRWIYQLGQVSKFFKLHAPSTTHFAYFRNPATSSETVAHSLKRSIENCFRRLIKPRLPDKKVEHWTP